MNYVGCTIPNINRYFFRCGITLCYRQAYDGTTTVDVALRVEDEVAQAVIDGLVTIPLHRLSRVRMVAYQTVGSCIHQLMGIVVLPGHNLHVVFPTPMQTDNDVALWVVLAQLGYLLT